MPILGVIADDFTGATDIANMLVHGGLRTVQCFGIPASNRPFDDFDAIVIALKSRSIPATEAVSMSLQSLDALGKRGIARFFFKYCSTFDSTDRGNIGPVAEALLKKLGPNQTVFCPAFPENMRTVYAGHLFVGHKPLNESGMEHHPLNPMTDANLVRVLQKQTHCRVGLLPFKVVDEGVAHIQSALQVMRDAGISMVITDAVVEEHLKSIAEAVVDWTLVTGGSGIARWLAGAYVRRGLVDGAAKDVGLPTAAGRAAILSGSCSTTTQHQIASICKSIPSFAIDVAGLLSGRNEVSSALQWSREQTDQAPILIYSTANPEFISKIHKEFGQERAAREIEDAFGAIACGLVDSGARRLIVAGGETAGAVVHALGVKAIRIGSQIAPGVPWTETLDEPKLALALKSGNFGGEDFFARALEMLP